MSSDKNQDLLEKQLKTLGQKIRIDILKKLSLSSDPLPYSSLQKEVLGTNPNSINFSFHLKALKNSVLIESSDNGYMLSLLGKQILKNIVSIEQILNNNNKTIMIRTSKYSKEPFDVNKIEEYLIKEGEVEKSEAEQIAREVEERLSKTNINYLTAPLMREYINVILLENGREEIRHKLTRLGTPPFEVHKNFDNPLLSPEQFLSKLGSDVSEQFLLLNLIPKNLADLYLSGDIALLNLNYWSLRPLALLLDTKSIVHYVQDRYSIKMEEGDLNVRDVRLVTRFFDTLNMFNPYFSEDIFLSNFFETLVINQNCNGHGPHLPNILMSQLFNHNRRPYDTKSHLSLEISNQDNFFDEIFNQITTNANPIAPFILFDFNKLNHSSNSYNLLIQNIKLGNCSNFVFYNKKKSSVLNSTLISATNSNDDKSIENRIVLDKILI
ncbi:MAG: ATP cone domain-containing protein, partial [Candidatus Hermodarchaeota archaeon]